MDREKKKKNKKKKKGRESDLKIQPSHETLYKMDGLDFLYQGCPGGIPRESLDYVGPTPYG